MDYLNSREGLQTQPEVSIQPAGEVGEYELVRRSNLTRMQMLYWVGEKLREGSPVFNTIMTFKIHGQVDPQRFRQAFQRLMESSDALRTVVEEIDWVPQQRTLEELAYQMDWLDLSAQADPEKTYQGWLDERVRQPLTLSERLFDTVLIKLSPEHYIWYLNQHHVITDATSFILVFKRLAESYEQRELEQAKLTPFADYLEYERSFRESQQQEKAQEYWRRKLVPGIKPLWPAGSKRSLRVRRESFDLGAERSRRIRELAQQKGIFSVSEEMTYYNLFAALFFAHLHKWTGNQQMGFLTPVHNRFSDRFRETIGLVMEICPLLVAMEMGETYLSLIKKVKRETRETLGYYQYGSGIVKQTSAFDVMFNLYEVRRLELDGALVEAERVHPGFGSESLALHVTNEELRGSFVVHFDFHEDLFEPQQRQAMMAGFIELIDRLLEDPHRQLEFSPSNSLHRLGSKSVEGNQSDRSRNSSFNADQRSRVASRDSLEMKLVDIWEEVLSIKPIDVKDNFFEIGGSSWQAVYLVDRIQQVLGTRLPVSSLLKAATVEEMARLIDRNEDEIPWSPLVPIQSQGSRPPLFFVHGAGGHVLIFKSLASHLGPEQPFFAFQAKGADGEQEPHTRVEELAREYVTALRAFQPQGPYYLGGYSMGGVVAFEMARQLKEQQQEVTFLAIIDVGAQSPHLKFVASFSRWLSQMTVGNTSKEEVYFLSLRHKFFRLRYFWFFRLHDFWQMDWRQKGGKFMKKFFLRQQKAQSVASSQGVVSKDNGGQGDLKDEPEENSATRMLLVNNQAYKFYIPQTYSGSVTLIRSTLGYHNPDKNYSIFPYLGWGRVIRGRITEYVIPGNHIQIIREPVVSQMAQAIRSAMDAAMQQIR